MQSKERTIFLVRHGETHGNVADKAQGHYDAALTKRGEEQAERLARRLAKTDFSTIYASDLQRARKTAEALIALRPELAINVRSELRETHYGDYENTLWSDLRRCDPDFFWKWINWETRPDARFPNGESERDVWKRVGTFAEEISEKHNAKEDRILIVAHGGPLLALLAQLLRLRLSDQWRFKLDNTSVTVLKEHYFLPSRWQTHLLNDTSHLSGMKSSS